MDNLPDSFRDALIGIGKKRKVLASEILIEAGDTCTDVYLIMSGKLRVSLLSRGGREPHLAELDKGHVFGELAAIDGEPRSATVSAITEATLIVVDAETFRQTLFQDREWVWWLLRALSARSRNLNRRTFEFATLSVNGRVISEIARLVPSNTNNIDSVELDNFPTHEELAARIGAQREAVTRSLRSLAKAGIIQQNRRTLRISTIQGLAKELSEEGGEWPHG